MQKYPGWKLFLEMCQSTTSPKELDRFLSFFLTPEEVDNMNKRVLLVQALLQNEKPQRDIAKDLQVSISKITRGSNGLKMIDEPLKYFLKQHLTEEG
jgi:TrpR family trp operon transcriptional repressor